MNTDSFSSYQLRILHISDLHERGAREPEHWRRRRVLGPAWESNVEQLLADGPIDLVCFTGDAADWGKADEYGAATNFFLSLLERFHLPIERLFLVPGNHDVHRKTEEAAWRRLRAALARDVDEQSLSRWLAGLAGPPLGCQAAWREKILNRQTAFWAWVVRDLGIQGLDPEVANHEVLGYRKAIKLGRFPFPIQLIGLNTAWMAGGKNDSGLLRLTENQLMRLATDANGKPLPGLRLALMHHPFSELADGTECRRLLAGKVDLVLRGHLHNTEVETWADPERQVRQVATGCLYEGHRADKYPNACSLLTLHLGQGGQPERVDLRFRAWSPKGHWHDDDSLYRDSRGGRLTWYLQPCRPENEAHNPFDPWTPVVPPRFVGRSALLLALDAALQEGRSVSIVGDWRIGKSSLLLTWQRQTEASGRTVRLLSGEGSEGVSPSSFVHAITGLPVSDDADGAADVLASWAKTTSAPGLPPLVLVDEADSLVARFPHRFLERLRGMLGKLCLVLTSRRELDLIYQELGRTSPFHNRLELRWLGLLDRAAAEPLVAAGQGILRPGDAEIMWEWAGLHPYYLALLGHHLVVARLQNENVSEAIDRFRDEADSRLRELWRVLEPKDREALLASQRKKTRVRRGLHRRGLVDDKGAPFGRVLTEWLRETNEV